MVESPTKQEVEQFRTLADRVLASSQLNRSARLSELFQYLCHRVLDEDVQEIHEMELGQHVFGRPARYDTTADNIVRVHASMLRKRLAEYFETEGRHEEFIIKIPRGNYAPLFVRREPAEAAVTGFHIPPSSSVVFAHSPSERPNAPGIPYEMPAAVPAPNRHWIAWVAGAAALAFAVLSCVLYLRLQRANTRNAAVGAGYSPLTLQFWSTVLTPNQTTDVVVDDASLGLYEEATGAYVPIGEYFDRSYMRSLIDTPGPVEQDPNWLHQLLLRRQSNYATSSVIWRLAQIAGAEHSEARLQFARDLSFQQAKHDNLVLLGTAASNPWIQLFESSLTLHWAYDPATRSFYPVDTTQPRAVAQYKATDDSKTRDGFATISLLSNLSGSGRALIISGSGGAATDAAMSWLIHDSSLELLRSRLPQTGAGGFPSFEALLRVEKSVDRPRSVTIAICRPLQSHPTGKAK